MAASSLTSPRRSSRVPATVPLLVTSMEEPQPAFSEMCETLMVSAHGCSLRSSSKLDVGAPVQFQSKDGNWTMAHIVDCQPLDASTWKLGAKLEKPTNWGLKAYPEDWARLLEMPKPRLPQELRHTDADLRKLVGELIEPLHAEVRGLRQRVEHREARRSNFDISLSYIPPEVQEKVGERLRKELGSEVLDKARLQSEQVLEATKNAIGQRITDARNQFREQLAQDLLKVEQRAVELTDEITAAVQQHIHTGEEQLQQKLLEAGIRLEKRGEEFFRVLQQRLAEEHAGYRKEMQQVHASAASEAADISAEVKNLTDRMSAIDASAQKLESELDGRLVRVASDIISGARNQLESALNVVLKDLGTRNSKELQAELDSILNTLKSTHRGIEDSVSQLVKTRVSDSLVTFGQTIEALAEDSVQRWRGGLAKDLNSMTEILVRSFQAKMAASTEKI